MAGLHIKLVDFIIHNRARPWEFGTVDCCLAPADWNAWLGFPDVAADLRGTYHDDPSCRAKVESVGGIEAFGRRLEGVGWSEVEHPSEGCIAVVGSSHDTALQWGAIFFEDRWLIRQQEGFTAFTAHARVIWEPTIFVARDQALLEEGVA